MCTSRRRAVGSSDLLGVTLMTTMASSSTLMLRNQYGVVVRDQPPAPLLLYPYPRKPIVTGNSFAFILPNHCGEASLHRRVFVHSHLHLVGGDRLKFQIMRSEICKHLRFRSYCTAWAYADEIVSVDAVERR